MTGSFRPGFHSTAETSSSAPVTLSELTPPPARWASPSITPSPAVNCSPAVSISSELTPTPARSASPSHIPPPLARVASPSIPPPAVEISPAKLSSPTLAALRKMMPANFGFSWIDVRYSPRLVHDSYITCVSGYTGYYTGYFLTN